MTRVFQAAALLALAGCTTAVENLASCYQCGEGTDVSGEACVAAAGRAPCGGGTREVDGRCVVDASTCGPGATLVGTRCEVTPAACAAGLVFSAGQCRVPGAAPQVRPFLDRTGVGVAQQGRALVYGAPGNPALVQMRYLKTELTSTDASAWVLGAAPMIGTGLAVHFSGKLTIPYGTSETATQVTDDTQADGACKAGVAPDQAEGLHVGVYRWSGGKPEAVVCGRTGSARVYRGGSYADLTLSVLMGDGNAYQVTTSLPIGN